MPAAPRVVALLAAALTAGSPVSTGSAGEPPVGPTCAFLSVPHPTATGVQVGAVTGGPIAVPGAVATTLRCTVQVWPNERHTDADAASASASGPGVVVLAPTPVSYGRPDPHHAVGVCAEATVTDALGGATTYYEDPATGWTTDPGAACDFPTPCFQTWCDPVGDAARTALWVAGGAVPEPVRGPAFATVCAGLAAVSADYWGSYWGCDPPAGPRPPFDPVLLDLLVAALGAVDALVCPVLGGDVDGGWDCPPYGS